MGKKRSWDHVRRRELAHANDDAASSSGESEGDDERLAEEAALASAAGDGGESGVGAGPARARGTYNRAALLQRLADISDDRLDWVESLDCCEAPLDIEDAEDDLQREVAFFNIAKAAVHTCSTKLQALGEPYKRPDDYFAEMVKSDRHMARVKDQLIFEQRKMAAFEMRKTQQQHKKRAKQVQQEKLRSRAEEKKGTIEAVKKWRKTAADRRGLMDDEDGFEQVLHAKPDRAPRQSKRDLPQKGKKRLARDAKFGFGGKKRFAKRNNAESAAADGFNLGAMRASKTVGQRKKGKKGARPGKQKRAQMRSGGRG